MSEIISHKQTLPSLENTQKKPSLAPSEFTLVKPFRQIMLALIPPRKSESPEVVGRLGGVTAHVNLPTFHSTPSKQTLVRGY